MKEKWDHTIIDQSVIATASKHLIQMASMLRWGNNQKKPVNEVNNYE